MSELPNGWVETELKSIQLDDSASLNPANFKDTIYEMYSVPSYETNSPEYLKGSEIGSSKKLVSTGSVLLCRINPRINRVWIVGNHSEYQKLASTEWVIFEQVNGIENKYLQYFLMKPDFRDYLQMNVSGVGGSLTRANKAAIANYPLWLPPHAEQKRIVEKIEALFSRLDAGIAALEKTKSQLNRYKQSVLKAAFERNIVSASSIVKGVDVFSFVTSGSRGWAKYYSDAGSLFVRMGNIHRMNINLDLSKKQFVALPATTEGKRTKLNQNDLLITITADVGAVAVVQNEIGDAYINQHLALARPNEGNNSKYLAWYLLSENGGQQQFREMQRGATKVGLGLDDIRNLNIPVPDYDEQLEVVSFIEKHFSSTDKALETVEQELRKAQALKSKILEYAFTGKLVPQNPDDEPADKLLERIKAEKEASKPTKKTIKRK